MKGDNTVRGRQVCPTNPFIELKKQENDQSIPDGFEPIARTYPDRLAVKNRSDTLTSSLIHISRIGCRTVLPTKVRHFLLRRQPDDHFPN